MVIINRHSREMSTAQWLAKNQFEDQNVLKKGHVFIAFGKNICLKNIRFTS